MRLITVPPLATLQDLGRTGYQHLGIPVAGAMDEWALLGVNRLVGNGDDAAAVELGWGELVFEVSADVLLAVAGVSTNVWINETPRPPWTALYVRRGQQVRVQQGPPGRWGYVAVAGGFEVPVVLGACATDLRGGFGGWHGRTLQAGDILPLGSPPPNVIERAGATLLPKVPQLYPTPLRLRVLPSLQPFPPQTHAILFNQPFQVSEQSDRMGYRLHGPQLLGGGDVLSSGLVRGAIQVPAAGQPLVMMADHPTTGGYALLGVVIRADGPVLAQCPPSTTVWFTPITQGEAQAAYQAQHALLHPFWPTTEFGG